MIFYHYILYEKIFHEAYLLFYLSCDPAHPDQWAIVQIGIKKKYL